MNEFTLVTMIKNCQDIPFSSNHDNCSTSLIKFILSEMIFVSILIVVLNMYKSHKYLVYVFGIQLTFHLFSFLYALVYKKVFVITPGSLSDVCALILGIIITYHGLYIIDEKTNKLILLLGGMYVITYHIMSLSFKRHITI